MKAFISIPLRVLTHNIRYATTSPEPGEELWSVRAPKLISELKYHMRHVPTGIICLQEVLHSQLEDIMAGLNVNRVSSLMPDVTRIAKDDVQEAPRSQQQRDVAIGPLMQQRPEQANILRLLDAPESLSIPFAVPSRTATASPWDFIGKGRDDGLTAGEYSPILYQPRIWKLVEKKTIWLSDTPSKPGKGWDAASPRILTIAVLNHREVQRDLIVMNTHFDDQGLVARNKSAHLILDIIGRYQDRYGSTPIVLAGDLNSETNEEAYRIIIDMRSRMYDVRSLVRAEDQYGDNNTFTGFGKDKPQRIDFAFVSDSPHWRVQGYTVAANRFDDGVYISDHRAVIADLEIIDVD